MSMAREIWQDWIIRYMVDYDAIKNGDKVLFVQNRDEQLLFEWNENIYKFLNDITSDFEIEVFSVYSVYYRDYQLESIRIQFKFNNDVFEFVVREFENTFELSCCRYLFVGDKYQYSSEIYMDNSLKEKARQVLLAIEEYFFNHGKNRLRHVVADIEYDYSSEIEEIKS